ncbi:glycosyltransferase family 61 protein [Enterobacter vonholyi]|uniref:glycosyltransferase 61 family protein n=1 Tax=Enterobacteriaceae TaxID=543 RepID=UPI000E210A82|nr:MULTISPECIES: glycosyltransferase family 61 protein [Enterobacteriaceae]MCL5637143.1 glycosyltransferase family 61 protein [Enterobacter vonholyi]
MNNVYFLKNAKIVPYSLDCREVYDNYIHGIVHDDLTSPVRGLVRGDNKKLLINEDRLAEINSTLTYKYESGTYFYIGPFINQFGHLITQTLSRAWAYNEYKEIVDKIIILGRSANDTLEKLPKHVLDLFDFFKLDRHKICFITEAVQIEKLIAPAQSHGIGFREPWHKKEFSSFYEKGKYTDDSLPKKIFISRRFFKLKGRLAGLDVVTDVLKKNNYAEVFPEKLALEQQIKLFYNASHIIAEEGSALHTLDLIPEIKAKVFLISRRKNYPTFIDLIKRVTSESYIFDDVQILDTELREANALSVSFSLNSLIHRLKEYSFITDDNFSQSELNDEIVKDIAEFYKSKENIIQ